MLRLGGYQDAQMGPEQQGESGVAGLCSGPLPGRHPGVQQGWGIETIGSLQRTPLSLVSRTVFAALEEVISWGCGAVISQGHSEKPFPRGTVRSHVLGACSEKLSPGCSKTLSPGVQ